MTKHAEAMGGIITLGALVDTYRTIGVLTAPEVQRAKAVLGDIERRTMDEQTVARPMDKLARATAFGTMKLLVDVYCAAGLLVPGEMTRLHHIILDAMARKVSAGNVCEDRG